MIVDGLDKSLGADDAAPSIADWRDTLRRVPNIVLAPVTTKRRSPEGLRAWPDSNLNE
jgi:hypothetical protein